MSGEYIPAAEDAREVRKPKHRADGEPDKGRGAIRDALYSPDPSLRPVPKHRATGGGSR